MSRSPSAAPRRRVSTPRRSSPTPATYAYCLVEADAAPDLAGAPAGLPATGPPRAVAVAANLWLIAADAPLGEYGETEIARGLEDLEWVSARALAHERVVEHCHQTATVIPLKLLTLFASDERAREALGRDAPRLRGVAARLRGHREWGVRATLQPAVPSPTPQPARPEAPSGRAFLEGKRAQREAARNRLVEARDLLEELYRNLAALAAAARRRPPLATAEGTGATPSADAGQAPLLLDAVFLVGADGGQRFEAELAERAAALRAAGCELTLTGPWPPYSFVEDAG